MGNGDVEEMDNERGVSMETKSEENSKAVEPVNYFGLTDTVKIGKSIYIVERHFSNKRDIKEAVYAAVKNEAFRAS